MNSSRTRVAPVLDQLYDRDPSGAEWLDRLIALGSRAEVVRTVPKGQRLVPNHGRRWGDSESCLPAPLGLLEYLVQHLDPARVAASGDTGETLAKRTALANRDPAVIAEALAALRSGKRGRKWFVLEGESQPDAVLETEQIVLCVEGKRTESHGTTITKWMPRRSQLVRHMDAALAFDRFRNKRVLGLLIAEGEGGADAVTPSTHWLEQSAEQYEESMLADSLPHRPIEERERIANGMLGVTTWQAVCKATGIDWRSIESLSNP